MKKKITSLVLNILCFVSVLVGFIMIFTSDRPSDAPIPVHTFRYFTTDSNLLMGIIALIFAVFQILEMKGKVKEIPSAIYLMKLIGTVEVGVTFFTVLFYLAPILGNQFFSMYIGHNFFYHFFVPVLSMVSFFFFETTKKIRFRTTFYSLIPVLLYGIFYAIMAFSHATDGVVPPEYDWYGFARGGILLSAFVFLGMLVASYLVTLLFWFLNRKLAKKEN